jgi:murein DD-endopeptidase MepM/ murein hydrolase activator NlpD
MIIPCHIDKGRFRKFGYHLTTRNLYHVGHDFNCPQGTPVYASFKGEVIYTHLTGGFGGHSPRKDGYCILIKHKFNLSLYGHVAAIVGDHEIVKEGQLIGHVHSYYIDGLNVPHLHFAIYKKPEIPRTKWGYVTKEELDQWVDVTKIIREFI